MRLWLILCCLLYVLLLNSFCKRFTATVFPNCLWFCFLMDLSIQVFRLLVCDFMIG